MNRRLLVSAGVLTVLIAAVVLATLPAARDALLAAAGTNPRAATPYTAPRTPDGQPDLQGFWSNARTRRWSARGT